MRTNAIHGILLATALGMAGCYSGFEADAIAALDEGADAGGVDDEPDPDDDNDSAGGGGEDPDDDGDAPEPAEEEDPFELPGTEARLLPFHVRMTNLANVMGLEKDHFVFDELYMRRIQLGDHDFSGNIAADLAWNPQKMGVWVKSLKPVCSSIQFQERYPNISADPTPLLQQILARDPDAEELAAYAAVIADTPDPAAADQLTCFAALSSLEFVAQ